MKGPDENFPVKFPVTEAKGYVQDLLTDFKKFTTEGKGRPFPYASIPRGKEKEAFSLIARLVEELNTHTVDIEVFSRALDYFTEIDQARGSDHLDIRGLTEEFETLRRKLINFLLTREPASQKELETFVELYIYLRLLEESRLRAVWRNRKTGVYDEFSYLKSIEISKAVRHIRKRLSEYTNLTAT